MSVKENVLKIHKGSMQILERTGMKFHHPDAIKVLKEHGIRVEGNVAYFTEEQVMKYIRLAPDTCRLYARNPEYDLEIGGNRVYNAPAAGPTAIMEADGSKRPAALEDYVNFMKLYETNPSYCVNGGIICAPHEIPAEYSTLALHYVTLCHTEKSIWTGSGSYKQMEAVFKMGCDAFGMTEEEMVEKPHMMTCINTNTPLQLDHVMTETMFTFLKYKQPVIIAAAAMAGTTSPITMAGTLAVLNAEVAATIALAQMYAPGSPVIYGSQSTNADMATCAIAIGSPEGALCYKYCAEMARFYGVPSRGGGSLTDAKSINVQAGYESMLTYYACKNSGVNLILQSAGIMESYLSASYEKMIVDFEIIRMVDRYERDFEVDEETLPLDLIEEVGPGGQYLLEDHTFEYCRKEPFIPDISVRGPHTDAAELLEKNIQNELKTMLESYKKPELSADTIEKMRDVLRNWGISKEMIAVLERY